jgi:hypothetical protein
MAQVTETFTGGCCEEAALTVSLPPLFSNTESVAWSLPQDWENTDFYVFFDGQSGIEFVSSLLTSTALTTAPIYPGFVQVPKTAGQPEGARTFGKIANEIVGETMLGWTDLYEYVSDFAGGRHSETGLSAFGNQLHKEVLEKTEGKRIALKLINIAEGGTLIEQIRKGTPHYNNFLDAARQSFNYSISQGRKIYVIAIVLGIGTANTQSAQTTDRMSWAESVTAYRRTINEDLLPMTAPEGGVRQEAAIPVILSQVRDAKGTLSANAYWRQINPHNAPQSGDELVTRLADGIFMAGPAYQYPTWPNPGLHLTSEGYRSYGCDLAHVTAAVFMGNKWTAVRWNPDETTLVDCQTVRLYFRRPNQYVKSASFVVDSISGDIAIVSGTDEENQVIIGQRWTGGTAPNDIEADTFSLGPADDSAIGGDGPYYISTSQTKTGPINTTAEPVIIDPQLYRGGLMIDDTGDVMATTGWETSKGFAAWDMNGAYLGNELEIQSVKLWRPNLDVARAFVDIRFKERPTGPVILTYGMKPRMFNSVTLFTINNAGSGGANGTFTGNAMTGGDPLDNPDTVATFTFKVQSGAITEITMEENPLDGIVGGLYTSETLPAFDFSASAGLTGADVTPIFTSTSGGSTDRGIGGLLRDDTAWGFDAGGNPRFNWAIQQAQVLPPFPTATPNLLYNGRGLVNQRAAGTIADFAFGHDRWFCNVSAGDNMAVSSTVDSDGEAFMVLTIPGATARRLAYAQQTKSEDTINMRGRVVTFGGRLYRSDATATQDNELMLGVLGWTGTADAMPWNFISDFADSGDLTLGNFYENTAGFVHLGAAITIVEPAGGKTNALELSVTVPANVNNLCFYLFTRQTVAAAGADSIGAALKVEFGRTHSGFPNETTIEALRKCRRFYQVQTVRTTNDAFWLSWLEAPLARSPTLSATGTATANGTTAFGTGLDNSTTEATTITINAEIGA